MALAECGYEPGGSGADRGDGGRGEEGAGAGELDQVVAIRLAIVLAFV